MPDKELANPEVECLKLKKSINENHRLAQKAAGDAVERGVLVGELLTKWKELLPHGRFESFVATHFEGSTRTAQAYMQAAKRLAEVSKAQRAALLKGDLSIEGLIGSLWPRSAREESKPSGAVVSGSSPAGTRVNSKPPAESKDARPDDSISAKGKPGGETPTSSETPPASSGPASDEAADSSTAAGRDARTPEGTPVAPEGGSNPPAVASDKLGKCPNCGSVKWKRDDFGCCVCAKCKHPHGEPRGDADEDRAKTQAQKTVKTAEALMRAFDDLNQLLPKPDEHTEAIASCKFLLKTARAWK